MTLALTFEARYPHVPEQVWRALTQPQALATWLMENNFEPYVGHCFQFRETTLPGLEIVIDCQVVALEPPKRLVYTWQTPGMLVPSMVTWTLTPIEGGTQLRLHHTGLTKAESALHPASFLQKQRPQPQVHPSSQTTSALSAMVGDSFRQDSVGAVALEPVSQALFEPDWHHRLTESLPQALAPPVTA